MCSLRQVVSCGIFLAVLDLLHGVATLSFYAYEFGEHYNCRWSHAIGACDYYLMYSNLNLRVNIGIGEGLACVFFSVVFILGLCKYKPWMTWIWLLKAIAICILNGYFLADWIVKRGRDWHRPYDEYLEYIDLLFIHVGVGLTLIQFFIMLIFCCVSSAFTYKVRKRAPSMETDIM